MIVFLNIGLNLVNLNLSGTMPVINEVLKIICMGSVSKILIYANADYQNINLKELKTKHDNINNYHCNAQKGIIYKS